MENAVKRRDIDYLLHFTRIENLDSILRNGIIPRQTLVNRGSAAVFNDQYRLDGHENASCLSIDHPNYKMFWSLRQSNGNQKWIVIGVKREILWLKDCAFCHENAASNNVTAIPIQSRKGVDAFEKIFLPAAGKPTREDLELPDCFPTNPQAEVLVFDIIEPKHIAGIAIQDCSKVENLKKQYPEFKFTCESNFYSARQDHTHW